MIVTSQSYYTDNLVARKLRELWIRLPDWSKQDLKPQYTAEEVGAMPIDASISYSSLDSAVLASLNKADTALLEEVDPIFTASPAHGINSEDILSWDNKQDELVAGTHINIQTNIISKNLWNPTNSTNSSPGFNATSRTVANDGTITIINNSGNAASRIVEEHTAAELGLENGKIYTLTFYCDSMSTDVNRKNILWYNGGYEQLIPASGTNHISVTWTQANNSKVQVGQVYFDNPVNGETKSYKIQLEQGNIKTDYVAYNIGKLVPVISATFTETDPVFTASPSYGITSTDITNWDNKQVKLRASTVIGSMYRTNVSGGGDISINGTSGQFPVITNAGTYLVITEMESTTQSYGLNVTFGNNQYTLNTTNGSFYDSRELTLTANSRWSGTMTSNVAANSKISVKVLKEVEDITTIGVVAITNDYADLLNKPTIPNVSGYFDEAIYDSDTKRINFKHENSILTYIDATAFIKDGMVDSVVIQNGKLVITFNTDSGKEPIEIDLTDIFDPSNYYDKGTVDTLLSTKANTADLATVATSGNYNDLSNTPTIPAALVQTDWNASSGIASILNKPTLATVATSGSYDDLSNKPIIPSAPGTLNTTAATALSTNASEALSGAVTLHKVSKTGSYNDLLNLPTIPDVTVKADKVVSATNGNFAGLDSNGNLTDSGHKHSDYLTSFTETDPVFTASAAHGISSSDISAWNGKASVTFRQWTTT